ncbi:MAG: LemA family protein [Methanobrevibacter smithii]|uniref:LemA family protein n=1 Tax=Methanobrevibacter TaxID=2172 RepID=UPI00037EBF03|nr:MULTISPECIES: LemA family protein [Methanobrevibacter]URN50312.1 LemA family protein [Methanobrevibacter sp. TLL-48-HuF1]
MGHIIPGSSVYVLIILIILAGIISYTISIYNDLVTKRNQVKSSWSKIDVQLKRRTDLIPNLVEIVKGYAQHEKETFSQVSQARASLMNARNIDDIQKSNSQLSRSLVNLFAIAERYPELKANTNFLNLQGQIQESEDKIAIYRERFNNFVLVYNNSCEQFPGNLVAQMFGFKTANFIEISEDEKAVPKVQF